MVGMVAPGALVVGSTIGRGCRVEAGAEVLGAHVHNDVRVEAGTSVLAAVVCERAKIGGRGAVQVSTYAWLHSAHRRASRPWAHNLWRSLWAHTRLPSPPHSPARWWHQALTCSRAASCHHRRALRRCLVVVEHLGAALVSARGVGGGWVRACVRARLGRNVCW